MTESNRYLSDRKIPIDHEMPDGDLAYIATIADSNMTTEQLQAASSWHALHARILRLERAIKATAAVAAVLFAVACSEPTPPTPEDVAADYLRGVADCIEVNVEAISNNPESLDAICPFDFEGLGADVQPIVREHGSPIIQRAIQHIMAAGFLPSDNRPEALRVAVGGIVDDLRTTATAVDAN